MEKTFATCFGFTEAEVQDSCEMFGLSDRFEEVKRWYNGYRFGGLDMYNPWSITCYLGDNRFREYWVNTGSMDILIDIFFKGTPAVTISRKKTATTCSFSGYCWRFRAIIRFIQIPNQEKGGRIV